MDRLVSQTVLHFDRRNLFRDDNGRMIGEFSRDYAPDMGMTVCGEFDENGDFHPDYSFPYKQSFAGAVDDPRVGITIIFYVINMGQILCKCGLVSPDDKFEGVKITGLAREGKIILPAIRNEWWDKQVTKSLKDHIKLVNEARKGDEDAIENLTLEDMDTYSMLQRRVEKEDILSIVETNFMPYGIECDQYTIVGTIMDVQKLKNDMSEEEVWKMELSVCNMSIDVCINAESLIGEPSVGRRFRGQIWLQGTVQV